MAPRPPLAAAVAILIAAGFGGVATAQGDENPRETKLPKPPSSQPVDQSAGGAPAGVGLGGQRVVARRATSLAEPTPAVAPEAERSEPPPELPALHHHWARFRPGAWRQLRITTESFDANGRFLGRSTTLQTETLTGVSEGSYTLEAVSIVEVGGKRLRGASQTMTYPLLCDEPCETLDAQRLDTANISLDGAVAPVERWRLRYGEPGAERVETVYYSPDRSPYILRRECAPAEGTPGPETTISVTRVDAPRLLDGGIVPTAHVSLVTRNDLLQEDRFEVHCEAVPGGLVSASSTERDASGRRVRWSTVELEGYGDTPPTAEVSRRWRPLQRLRKQDRERSQQGAS